MKSPYKQKLSFPVEKSIALPNKEIPFMWMELPNPISYKGNDFRFVVGKPTLSPEGKLACLEASVLCQTKEEANESVRLLTLGERKVLVVAKGTGLGSVGYAKEYHETRTKIGCKEITLPDGKTVWITARGEQDEATGEVTVNRVSEPATKEEALRIRQQWIDEVEKEDHKFIEAQKKATELPKLPMDCDKLTENDRNDVEKAQMAVLRKQWKHCFEIFDNSRGESKFSEDYYRAAYCIDLAEQGMEPPKDTLPDCPPYTLIGQALKRASSAKKKSLGQLVDYLIAFKWLQGWCYLSDKELAKEISDITKKEFKPDQAGKRRERLGLVAKHHSGSS